MDFFGLAGNFKIHQIAHGKKGDQPPLAGDREVAAVIGLHRFHGFLRGGAFLDRANGPGHDVANGGAVGIAVFENDPHHQVPLAEDAREFLSLQDQDGTHMESGHDARDFGNGLMLFDAEEFALMDDI
jgi:hypothetical protein